MNCQNFARRDIKSLRKAALCHFCPGSNLSLWQYAVVSVKLDEGL
jgi:hypothetical protein